MGVVDEVEDHKHTMCDQDLILEAGASLRMTLALASDRSICALISGHESKIPPGEQGRAVNVKERAKRGCLLSVSASLSEPFRKARPICFVAAKDLLGSSIFFVRRRKERRSKQKNIFDYEEKENLK